MEKEKTAAVARMVTGLAHEIDTNVEAGITAAGQLAEQADELSEAYRDGLMRRSSFESFLAAARESSELINKNLQQADDLLSMIETELRELVSTVQRPALHELLERDLAWADLAEAIIWLVILASIEIIVRLQERGVTGGRLILSLNRLKAGLYLALVGIGIYWAVLGHWLYLWDELVWIGGFMAIEMNISEWRGEIIEAAEV